VHTARIEIATRDPALDVEGRSALAVLREESPAIVSVRAARVYLLSGLAGPGDALRAARELLADPVMECFAVDRPALPVPPGTRTLEIARLQGVMEPAEQSVKRGLAQLGIPVDAVRLSRRYLLAPAPGAAVLEADTLRKAAFAHLANAMAFPS